MRHDNCMYFAEGVRWILWGVRSTFPRTAYNGSAALLEGSARDSLHNEQRSSLWKVTVLTGSLTRQTYQDLER